MIRAETPSDVTQPPGSSPAHCSWPPFPEVPTCRQERRPRKRMPSEICNTLPATSALNCPVSATFAPCHAVRTGTTRKVSPEARIFALDLPFRLEDSHFIRTVFNGHMALLEALAAAAISTPSSGKCHTCMSSLGWLLHSTRSVALTQ